MPSFATSTEAGDVMTSGQLWRLYDPDPSGAIAVRSLEEAHAWNARDWGIFATVNRFDGPRQIPNLAAIIAWAIDIDTGTKAEQRRKLRYAPLAPSIVVEVKRGYHVYWLAKDATPERWNDVVADRLVPYFGADKNARDLARILRVPGFRHLKDPADPFDVREVHRSGATYTEAEMLAAFPAAPKIVKTAPSRPVATGAGDFWERVASMDARAALERLSGTPAVNGEEYDFRPTRGGWNILVNGKGSSCWIDANGRIGSADGGGPTVAQWLKWFGRSYREVAELIRRYFPEVEQ